MELLITLGQVYKISDTIRIQPMFIHKYIALYRPEINCPRLMGLGTVGSNQYSYFPALPLLLHFILFTL